MKKMILLLITGVFLVSCSGNTDEDGNIFTANDTTMEEMQEQILDTKTILALGDSLTAGYGVTVDENYPSKLEALLEEEGYNYEVINAGVSGDTSQNLLDRANIYLDEYDPDIVLLVIGGNDGLRGQSTETLRSNIEAIIDLYDNGERSIVLGGMEIPGNFGLSYTRDFRDLYFEIAEENGDIYFLESFLKDVGGVASLNLPDRIHPTPEGYDIIVANMYEFLSEKDIVTK